MKTWKQPTRKLNWPLGSKLLRVQKLNGNYILTFDDNTQVKLSPKRFGLSGSTPIPDIDMELRNHNQAKEN